LRTFIHSSFLRYLSAGLLNTCVGLGTIYVGMRVLEMGDVSANITGYALGILCSFLLNKYWTFAARGPAAPQLLKFLLVLGIAYLVNLAAVMTCIRILGLNRYLGQALGVPAYTIAGYLGSRYFAFGNRPLAQRPPKTE
jgi:putative flippase GtrA